jgi:hypothetical protein
LARALDALSALEVCVRADLLRGPVATETVPFVRPRQGTLYEADTLTWRFYHTNAGCVVHAICNKAYGAALARALCKGLFGFERRTTLDDEKKKKTETEEEDKTYAYYNAHTRAYPPSVDNVRAAILSVHRQLRDVLASSSIGHYCYSY